LARSIARRLSYHSRNTRIGRECSDKPLQEYKLGVGPGARRIKPSQEVDNGARTHLAFSDRDDKPVSGEKSSIEAA
jgi:hypothetical protein